MQNQKKVADSLMSMTVTEGVTVNLMPNPDFEFLMTRKEVANGYGASKYSILQALHNHPDELIEGKHYVLGGKILLPPNLKGIIQTNSILFTKRGVVRLGFFIKSERAKLFRDWAEELIIQIEAQSDLFGKVVVGSSKLLPKARRHNRLSSERIIKILALVNEIEDKELRMNLSNEITGGYNYGN